MAKAPKLATTKNEPKAKTGEPEEINREFIFTKALNEIPKFYINNTHSTYSVMDFRLTLCQYIDAGPERAIAEPQTIIHMSPQHVRTVIGILSRQLEKYEAKYGQIPKEPDEKIAHVTAKISTTEPEQPS